MGTRVSRSRARTTLRSYVLDDGENDRERFSSELLIVIDIIAEESIIK